MTAGLPPRPIRRAVLDPIYLPLALVLAAGFGAVAVAARLIDQLGRLLLRRPTRGRVWRLAALAGSYLLLDLVMVLGSFWFWLRAPLPGRRRAGQWRAEHVLLLRWVLRWLFAIAGRTLRFTVLLDGPLTPPPAGSPPLLVLARHAGPGDSFTLVHLIAGYLGRCPRVVLKAALQWDPGLDVLLNRLSCCFLASATGAGDDRTEQLSELAAGLAPDDALLLFPEGGNWTPRRRMRAIRRLLRRGERAKAERAAANQHVLPPRPGGTLACLAAQPNADVLVVAHTGLADLVSPSQIWRALPLHDRHMLIGWWRVPVASLPAGDGDRADWLDEQWRLVDGWVAAHPTGRPAS